jgi:CrcB protein
MVDSALVAVGGAVGAVMRYWLSIAVARIAGVAFPVGTLIVNVLGCLAMGVLFAVIVERGQPAAWRALLMSGLLGGFTTFSAFSIETVSLFESGEVGKAVTYVLASVIVCIVACWGGLIAARAVG